MIVRAGQDESRLLDAMQPGQAVEGRERSHLQRVAEWRWRRLSMQHSGLLLDAVTLPFRGGEVDETHGHAIAGLRVVPDRGAHSEQRPQRTRDGTCATGRAREDQPTDELGTLQGEPLGNGAAE